MKIAVFDDLPEGGAKRVVFEQVKGLLKRHELYYFTNTVASQFGVADYVKDIYRFDLDVAHFGGVWRPLQELSVVYKLLPIYKKIALMIENLGIEVVLAHPSRITQAPLLLFFLKTPSVYFAEEWPRVVYEPKFHSLPTGFHGVYEWGRRQMIKIIDRNAALRATKIVTTSTYMAEQLSKIYDRKVWRLPLGVDLNTFCPNKSRKRQNYFLFVGEKEAISGYVLLSQVLKTYKFQVKQITFNKNKQFRLDDQTLAGLYQRAVATLCLAEDEPFGLTALESMACGTPVIAVNSGGHVDTVVDGKTGWLVVPEPAILAGTMRRAIEDKLLIEEMGQAGRAWVESRYNWDKHILGVEKILKEVL